MMHVNTMRLVVDDLVRGSLDVPEACAARWEHDPGTLRYVRSSSSFVFRLRKAGRTRFLRLAHESERGRAELEAELAFVRHLASRGCGVARPVRSRAGLWVEDVDTARGTFRSVAFERAPGQPRDAEEIDEAAARGWGRAMGELHLASEDLDPDCARDRRGWESFAEVAARSLASEAPRIRRRLADALRWLADLPRDRADFGLIHGDFALDNLYWDEDRVCVIDFDDVARAWFALDVAIALDEVRDRPDRTRLEAGFLEGYRGARRLDERWVEALPRFARLRELLQYGVLLDAYRGADPAKDPEWLAAVRARHRGLLDARRERCASGPEAW